MSLLTIAVLSAISAAKEARCFRFSRRPTPRPVGKTTSAGDPDIRTFAWTCCVKVVALASWYVQRLAGGCVRCCHGRDLIAFA